LIQNRLPITSKAKIVVFAASYIARASHISLLIPT
jgi:hypothetical protein